MKASSATATFASLWSKSGATWFDWAASPLHRHENFEVIHGIRRAVRTHDSQGDGREGREAFRQQRIVVRRLQRRSELRTAAVAQIELRPSVTYTSAPNALTLIDLGVSGLSALRTLV